ncbi:MAG: DEAD/DEAH box helicase [Rhizobiales bacterium]|nr:DEAD/DEAH box helicase [Hyphomicrobiales bacterium]
MHFIHLFWQQQYASYDNTGQLYLWVEQSNKLDNSNKKQVAYFPYQLSKNALNAFVEKQFKHPFYAVRQPVYLPCNEAGEGIPSALIANLINLEDDQVSHKDKFHLNTVVIDGVLVFLKELNFLHYYFSDDIRLADDAKFWIKMAAEISHVVKNDQYIPVLVAKEVVNKDDGRKTKKTHKNKQLAVKTRSKWVPFSSKFKSRLEHIATCMPASASLGKNVTYDAGSVLTHFSEVSLTKLIASTQYPQKIYKLVEGSVIEQCLSTTKSSLAEDQWKAWKLWQNNLSYDQFGAKFNICFRLREASSDTLNDWHLEILLQSKNTPSFMINLSQYWSKRSFSTKLTKAQRAEQTLITKMLGTDIDRTLLLQLGYASRIYPLIDTLFTDHLHNTTLILSGEQAFEFLKEDAWALHAGGYHIIVPSWWTNKGRLKAKIKLRVKKNTEKKLPNAPGGYFNQDTLLNFNYQYAIGEQEVSPDEWQQLIKANSELVYFRGQWVAIDINEMEKMQQLIESSQRDKHIGSIKDLLVMSADDQLYEIDLDDNITDMLAMLNNKEKFSTTKQPSQLLATLRPYQNRGLAWLNYLESLGMNPCLADDMGLGKTMQIISLLLASPKQNTVLLVAPTSVVGNWQRELKTFAPSLKVQVHHGSKRKQKNNFIESLKGLDILITSYGLVRQDKVLFNSIEWSRLIVDEAQNIKNPMAMQTKVLCSIKAKSRIALTGTPIENRLMDLWSIFNFLNPGFLGTKTDFRKTFELPIQRDNHPQKTQMLKTLVEPFILRRLKSDKNIISDLPDKVEQKIYCELTTEQASIYQTIVNEVEIKLAEAKEVGIQTKGLMLSTLLRLKQCCNHPTQVLQDGSEFSQERSIKLQRVIEMIKETIDNGESTLVFSQFTEICQQLTNVFKHQLGIPVYYLHGGTSAKQRDSMIEKFQSKDAPPAVFVLSLKAGGVGITLTKANHVIHFDRWWNPSVENQATDRAYRIGQQKTVFAHKFVMLGTVEERIDNMLMDKQKMSDAIIGNDESWLTKLDPASFIDLIRLSKAQS